MGNMNVQQRKFIVKAGMTAEDVKSSKEATVMQKKYASTFDTDGTKGFSQKEADLFNATTFAEKADGTVTFWTRQKDGTKKGTKFNSNDNNIQFKSEDEVKPYIKQVKVKKATQKKEESVSFFDEKWSGHQIAKLTGDNVVTDWLQDKDKKCTDGKDDGKIGFWEGTKSFAKGLVGGIPKAMINHPITTAVTVAAGAGAIALTGGAILPVLGAVGVATGVGMAGYGGYKAVTAKTDGEAKQALETMGMGVTTTALSVASADKALEKAAEAGVKSAQVSEDAGILDKTFQMFKATPEALTKSKEWSLSYIKGTPVNIEQAYNTTQAKENNITLDNRASNTTLSETSKPIENNSKKTYVKPELKEVSLNVEEDLCSSSHKMIQSFLKSSSGSNSSSSKSYHVHYRETLEDRALQLLNKRWHTAKSKTSGIRGWFNKMFDSQGYIENLKIIESCKNHRDLIHSSTTLGSESRREPLLNRIISEYSK